MKDGSRVKPLVIVAVLVSLGLVFWLDAQTGAAPFQHLYYIPIVIAGLGMSGYAGPAVGVIAVALYHIANPALLTTRYGESDIVQMALFLAIGVVTSRLAEDRRVLRHLSITDDLTGLLNLRGFEEQLATVIRLARQTTSPISVLVLDVDRLKSINDAHGHRAGADSVRTVGRLVAGHLPPHGFACRFGGDEFVIALPQHGREAAETTAETLRNAVHAAAPRLAGMKFPAGTLSISVGLACQERFDQPAALVGSSDGAIGEALFRAADQALYLAKAGGRNQVRRETT